MNQEIKTAMVALQESRNGYSAPVSVTVAAALVAKLGSYVKNGSLAYKADKSGVPAFCGVGAVSRKWNVRIHHIKKTRPNRGLQSVTTNDIYTLINLLDDGFAKVTLKEGLPIVSIDDAGWGFPFGGVMVGIECNGLIATKVAEYESNLLEQYANCGLEILKERNLTPDNCQIQICTGHVNRALKDVLRGVGYHVVVTEIRGALQDGLEELYKQYIRDEFGFDGYYDPKEVARRDIPNLYKRAVRFMEEHNIAGKWPK